MLVQKSKSNSPIGRSVNKSEFLRTLAMCGKTACVTLCVGMVLTIPLQVDINGIYKAPTFWLCCAVLGLGVILVNKHGSSTLATGARIFDDSIEKIKNIFASRVKENLR